MLAAKEAKFCSHFNQALVLTTIRQIGPVTAKLCHLAICKLPSISRCGTSARGPTIYRTALRLPELA